MSYEQTVRAKHDFEDSFMHVLRLLSAMDRKELEIAAARLGDGLEQRDDLVDPSSALLTITVIQMVLELRRKGEISQSAILRLWLRRQKKQYALHVATIASSHENTQYQAERARVETIRAEELNDYNRQFDSWDRLMQSLPLWRRLFDRPPYPVRPELSPLPTPPIQPSAKAREISKSSRFSELLTDVLYLHKYPHIEYAESYAQEERVRTHTLKLLAAKR